MASHRPRVIVIGAGIAGLAAASALHKSGKVDVRVLEGTDRVGGRIHTVDINGRPVELGANWLHGARNNPLHDLCAAYNLKCEEFYYLSYWDDEPVLSLKFYTPEGREVDDDLVQEVARVSDELRDECDEFSAGPKGDVDPFQDSVGKYLKSAFDKYLRESDLSDAKLKKRLFDWMLGDECMNCAVDSLDELSLTSYGNYDGHEDQNFIVCQGFGSIPDVLYHNLPAESVYFRHEVIKIDWMGSTQASSSPLMENSSISCPVTVTCSNGNKFTADHVIITVSLGVLKERARMLFCPPLPCKKLEAINKLGFGTVNKILLEFEEPLLSSEKCNGIGFLRNSQDAQQDISEAEKVPEWISHLLLLHPHGKDSSILIGWFMGSANEEIENIPREEIGNQCVRLLSRCTGKVLPALLRVERSCWHGNAFTRGSYSYIPVESDGSVMDDLAAPLPDETAPLTFQPPLQLLFAGEATNSKLYATAHGAFCSGIREAERILKVLN